MNKEIVIRKCNRNDKFLEISKLYFKVWQKAYKNILPESFLSKMNENSWHPNKKWNKTFLAESNKQIVGICTFGKLRNQFSKKKGEIYTIYVDPNYQKMDIGIKLILKAIQKLREKNYNSISLWVIYNNYSAIKFYEKIGFKKTSITKINKSKYGQFKEIYMILN